MRPEAEVRGYVQDLEKHLRLTLFGGGIADPEGAVLLVRGALADGDRDRAAALARQTQQLATTTPGSRQVEFRWRDYAPEPGKRSYYYVRGEQQNGEIVWASPFWITYTGKIASNSK